VPKPVDYQGRKFGRLRPVSRAFVRVTPSGSRKHYWLCQCDCGEEVVVWAGQLTGGDTQSCGCLRRELRAAKNRVHGRAKTPEYEAWCDMKARCSNPKKRGFANYGGRGIKVCEQWQNSFEDFLAHIGPKPSPAHSVDRIETNGHYEPGNVKWSTKSEQLNNQRKNVVLTLNGTSRTVSQWARILKINEHTLADRIRAGWSDERALTEPVRKWPSQIRS
jgi:hypothetical protein